MGKLQPHHHFNGVPRSIADRIGVEVKVMDPEDGFPKIEEERSEP